MMKKFFGVFLSLVLLLSFLPITSLAAANSTSFEEELTAYLEELSDIRGFEVTKDDIEGSLYAYGESLEDFNSIEELKGTLGEPIAADYSNLDEILSNYSITMDELKQILEENDDSLDYYVFLWDLDDAIYFYTEDSSDFDPEMIKDLVVGIQDELGLTNQEIENLKNHLIAQNIDLSSDEINAKLEKLGERMSAFDQFETLDELTPDQVKEFLSIFDELFAIFQIKADYTLIKDGKNTQVTLWNVLNMDELTNAKLKINIYDLSGKFLADLLITGEMVGSDIVKDVGKDIEKATETAKETKPAASTPVKKTYIKAKEPVLAHVKTVKGGQLPNTAGNYIEQILIGLLLLSAGIMTFRQARRAT
ncbi:processed acidic surface protein [Peribacillus sp. SCS-37]|uniref:processed acidic surface protein n=1 Tax=Paraperibacillus esterisolvens TaxID=3115296 RepID=UPI0039069183